MRHFNQKTTRKPPTFTPCDDGCPCGHTGFLMVVNDGQFRTAGGNKLKDPLVRVYCRGSKGERIRMQSAGMRLPTYDPETMRLPGESRQRDLF